MNLLTDQELQALPDTVKTTADVRDSAAITSQAFASQGTFTVTYTYTQS